MYPLTALEAGSEIEVSAGLVPAEAGEGESVASLSAQLLVVH